MNLADVRSLDVEAIVKPWAERVGVTGVSLQRYLTALGEVSDSIALLAHTLGASGQLLVQVEPFTSWITTRFSFSDTIPLDPKFDVQEEELQEFPGIIVQPDIFWRRLILKWVDKAQWSHKGNTVTIALSQYTRRPSSPGELYFLGISPRRIPNLELRPLEQEFSLALAPGLKTAFRLDRETRFLLETADGRTPVREVYRLYVRRFGLVHPEALGALVEDCIRKGLLIAGDQLKNETEKSSLRAWALRLSSLRVSIRQQDALFAALDHWLGWIWSRPALLLMFIFIVSTVSLFNFHVSPFMSLDMIHGISNVSVTFYLWFVLGLYSVVVLHEIAHGMACRRLGGRVGEFGLMFYCGLVCAFVDTTSAWAFPRRSDRILVSFAGPLSTIVLGCIFLWGKAAALYAGANYTFALFELLTYMSLMLSMVNLLPLLEFDGYYILVDLLNYPNLKQKTAAYWSTLFKRKNTELAAGEQIIYLLYGSGSVTILLLLIGVPLVGAVRSLEAGHITIDALLPLLTACLFFAQVLTQVGGRLFHYRRQLEIDLKEPKGRDFGR